MRKIKYILLSLSMLLCLIGCNNDAEYTTTETTTPTETSLSHMEQEQIKYKFQGEPRCVIRTLEATYKDSEDNLLSSVELDDIRIYGEGCESIAEAVEAYFELETLGKELHADEIDQWGRISNTRKLTCTRLDEAVISIRNKSRFSATWNGYGFIEGVTFDMESCEILELDDVIKDMEGFRKKTDELLPKLLAELVIDIMGDYTREAKEHYTELCRREYESNCKNKELDVWFLSEEGIVFGFEEGIFASYAVGCLEVTIPYDDIKEYMVEKYVP